jgi:hypothetical protein
MWRGVRPEARVGEAGMPRRVHPFRPAVRCPDTIAAKRRPGNLRHDGQTRMHDCRLRTPRRDSYRHDVDTSAIRTGPCFRGAGSLAKAATDIYVRAIHTFNSYAYVVLARCECRWWLNLCIVRCSASSRISPTWPGSIDGWAGHPGSLDGREQWVHLGDDGRGWLGCSCYAGR